VQIPKRVRRRFHYFMTGVCWFVVGICVLNVAMHVISGRPTLEDLWLSSIALIGWSSARETLEWARGLKADDENDMRG
jgi:hypothetical protein